MLCRVDREQRATDTYKRINPLGRVPAMRVDGRTIVENAAVLAHLAARKPALGLMPADGTAERDAFNQWMSHFGTTFHIAYGPFFGPARYIKDEAQFPAVKDKALENVRAQYKFMDERLAKNEFILGSKRTALDPYFYGMARWAERAEIPLTDYSNVLRWKKALETDPAVAFALATERGESAKSPSGACLAPLDLTKL